MSVRGLSLLGTVAVMLVAASAGAVDAQGASQKFAYVDSRVIVQRAPGTASAEDALRKDDSLAQGRIKLWQDSLQAMFADYQVKEKTMTEAQKTARQKTITDKQADYAKRAEDLDAQLKTRQQELSQPIMAQIRETLDALRVEDGYTFIFDVSAGGVIVAVDKNLDLTEKVIGRLKPIPVAARVDSAKALGAKPLPAGVTKKPPTQ